MQVRDKEQPEEAFCIVRPPNGKKPAAAKQGTIGKQAGDKLDSMRYRVRQQPLCLPMI
jgi:hypothetical protein